MFKLQLRRNCVTFAFIMIAISKSEQTFGGSFDFRFRLDEFCLNIWKNEMEKAVHQNGYVGKQTTRRIMEMRWIESEEELNGKLRRECNTRLPEITLNQSSKASTHKFSCKVSKTREKVQNCPHSRFQPRRMKMTNDVA